MGSQELDMTSQLKNCYYILKILLLLHFIWASLESPPAVQETQVRSMGREDPGEGTGYPLQYSCLENSVERGVWQATVHGVT